MTPAQREHALYLNEFEATFGSPQDWVGCWSTWRDCEERFLAAHPAQPPRPPHPVDPAAEDTTDPTSHGDHHGGTS